MIQGPALFPKPPSGSTFPDRQSADFVKLENLSVSRVPEVATAESSSPLSANITNDIYKPDSNVFCHIPSLPGDMTANNETANGKTVNERNETKL